MKKILLLTFALLLMGSLVMAMVSAKSGAIWTTKDDCGDSSQDVNHYAVGDAVYINGAGFDAGTYDWDITGQPGGASCDPSTVVASGTDYPVGEDGSFCFPAYTVQDGDCGEYKVDFGGKGDNYRVDLSVPTVPEFGATAGIATILGALGLFFVVRRA